MNTDTQRAVNDILRRGYYEHGTTLGEGGWPYLYQQGVDQWHEYRIYFDDEPFSYNSIHAKNARTARAAFASLYELTPGTYEIGKVSTSYKPLKA